jgi:hypothetical protein
MPYPEARTVAGATLAKPRCKAKRRYPSQPRQGSWRGAGVVERGGLENRCRGNPPTEGSNPSPSAEVPRSLVGAGFRAGGGPGGWWWMSVATAGNARSAEPFSHGGPWRRLRTRTGGPSFSSLGGIRATTRGIELDALAVVQLQAHDFQPSVSTTTGSAFGAWLRTVGPGSP